MIRLFHHLPLKRWWTYHNDRGFSLMELTLMIAVGAILLVGVGRAIQNQMVNAIDMRNFMVSLNLVKRQMAVMNNAAYPAVGTTSPATDALFPNFTFTRVVTAVAANGANNIRRIQMDVSIGGDLIVRVYTYRTNTATFGNGT